MPTDSETSNTGSPRLKAVTWLEIYDFSKICPKRIVLSAARQLQVVVRQYDRVPNSIF